LIAAAENLGTCMRCDLRFAVSRNAVENVLISRFSEAFCRAKEQGMGRGAI
jgi:hypothetical protein